MLRLLPVTAQALVLGAVEPVGLLDYKRKPIRMTIGSKDHLYRLLACWKEPETVNWLESNVRSGDVLYDIGANVGAYSLIAFAVSGSQAKVYAFEPSFPTFNSLSRNVFLNQAQGSVIPLHIALSDRTAVAEFQYRNLQPGAAKHELLPENSRGGKSAPFVQRLLAYRIDDLIEQFGLEAPDLIKLDVDGHEFSVLQGAEKTLRLTKTRSVVMEMDSSRPEHTRRIEEWMSEKGFRVVSKHQHKDSTIINCIFVRGLER